MTVRIGVEEEFHLVRAGTGRLAPCAGPVLEGLPQRSFTTELQRAAVETNSAVHTSLYGLYSDLVAARRTLDAAAAAHGLAVVAAGTVPLGRPEDTLTTAGPRYARMADDYRRVADEQLICGAHVHVDVPDRDTAVRVMCEVSPWLPVLLALSASSPFWSGADTGYASWRTMLWQRWPTAGPAGCFADAAAYDAAVRGLVGSGVISDPGMIYYDIRPSAHQRTLELRVCDSCPRAETVVLVAGLFRALVTEACLRQAGPSAPRCDGRHEWLRAATWRAARSGLEDGLVHPVTRREAAAADVVHALLDKVRPVLTADGDRQTLRTLAEQALADGGAARRARRAAAAGGLAACTDHLAAETRGGGRGARPAAGRTPPPAVPAGALRARRAGVPGR
ncbi:MULTISPECIES: carboxylate-amine ligase [Streptomyces]|uniref:Putative glutamate--cysteine ligase 2 n=2 Tax=Streptomyces TaxID=1883 RepID=A0ABT9LQ57_STRGD|nr:MULTISPECIES: glutamate--cysteine ligase [Streptomyces]MDP9685625.1 carboxylate-amine ligase [Streptomyces griseoviridis]GGS88822.1 putative glutamate--cysteine ligase 2-2 [Streptomyces griseoviridis]GGU55571.1 putative glutamate--cysteine ligase 2-2 [Streptomyces daghestanicus]GHI34917.1 putative glutamate--cysteine ligase 2-2 [Streptomyces daghestanicus]